MNVFCYGWLREAEIQSRLGNILASSHLIENLVVVETDVHVCS